MKRYWRVATGVSLGVLVVAAIAVTGAAQPQRAKRVHPLDLPHPTKEILQPTVLTKHELYSEDRTAEVVAVETVFSAYTFANDSHNGPLAASLFTEDAIVHFVYNTNGSGVMIPTFGINPRETPNGTIGEGCVLTGRKDIATYFGYNRTANLAPEHRDGLPMPWPGHHMVTNKMTKIDDAGKQAMLTATWLTAGVAPRAGEAANANPGIRPYGTGMYRIFFRKTSDGWLISEFYGISERPSTTTQCDLKGPLPRPTTD